jgi:hypothetical protein
MLRIVSPLLVGRDHCGSSSRIDPARPGGKRSVAGLLRRRARASPEAVFGSRAQRIEVNEAGEEPPIGLAGRCLEMEGHCARGVG